ncbi:unnamed protein product, partial [Ectocarpus sp. 4 AP-2014]
LADVHSVQACQSMRCCSCPKQLLFHATCTHHTTTAVCRIQQRRYTASTEILHHPHRPRFCITCATSFQTWVADIQADYVWVTRQQHHKQACPRPTNQQSRAICRPRLLRDSTFIVTFKVGPSFVCAHCCSTCGLDFCTVLATSTVNGIYTTLRHLRPTCGYA